MRPEPKKKVSLNQSQPGLNVAFSGLDLGPLPEGPKETPAPPKDGPGANRKLGTVILRKETAQRGGKTVIVVHDFASHLPVSVIETIAKKIRQQCGCGGAVKDRTIEDRPPDFAKGTIVTSIQEQVSLSFDRKVSEDYIRRISAKFAEHRHIQNSEARLTAGANRGLEARGEGKQPAPSEAVGPSGTPPAEPENSPEIEFPDPYPQLAGLGVVLRQWQARG